MALKTSSNGKVLYIYNAGNTIDLYEPTTFKYLQHDHSRRRHDQRICSCVPAAASMPKSHRRSDDGCR